MNKIEIKWLKDVSARGAGQIYTSGIEYCFINGDGKQCNSFIFCKDFLQDIVWANINKTSVSPHGFKYVHSKKTAINMERTNIAIANQSDPEMGKKVEGSLDFVNQFAGKMHIRRTHLFKCMNPPSMYKKCGVYLFDGSGMWMNSPPLLSMYTLLLRAGFAHKKGDDCLKTMDKIINGKIEQYQENDQSQLSEAKEAIINIIKVGYRKFFFIDTAKNYPNNVDVYDIHESGIVGLANGTTEDVVKYWTRKSLESPD